MKSIVDGINLSGFSQPASISGLHSRRCSEVSTGCGIYVVFRESATRPRFLVKSAAGWFKGKDPSYPPHDVESNWVGGARVVYIGKTASQKGLRGSIRQLVDFAYGKAVGHRGGRLLWHLQGWKSLQVCWCECDAREADKRETELIRAFRRKHRVRPFANMSK